MLSLLFACIVMKYDLDDEIVTALLSHFLYDSYLGMIDKVFSIHKRGKGGHGWRHLPINSRLDLWACRRRFQSPKLICL